MNINNIFNKVNDFVNDKKEKIIMLNKMIDESKIFELTDNIIIKEELNEGNLEEYKEMCDYVTTEDAKRIESIIEPYEIVINIGYMVQKIDNNAFFMVLTDKKTIILNKEKYRLYNYNEIYKIHQINKGFMSQIINLNDIILDINVNQENLNIIYSIITDINYRNYCIIEKTKYLCGIKPVCQMINKIKSGISIDSNNNIVFHDRKINNYLCKYDDILNYELLEDNTPVLRKKTEDQKQGMGFTKKECGIMKLRVTLTNSHWFEIIILEPSTFNNTYSHTNSTYIKYYNFGKSIIDKLDSLEKKDNN